MPRPSRPAAACSRYPKIGPLLLAALLLSYGPLLIAAPYVRAWEFDNPAEFDFDPAKIEITDGVARLRPQLLPTGTALQLNLHVNGQSAAIADSAQSGLQLATDDFLFLAWVRLRNLATQHAVFQKRGLVNGVVVGLILQIEKMESGYRLRGIVTTPNGSADLTTATVIRDTDWNQIGLAIARTSGRAQFYVNGQPFDGQRDISGLFGSLSNPGQFRIGVDDTAARLVGDIDEASYWRFADGLPGDVNDIVAAHYAGTILDGGNLVSAWRFDNATGQDSAGTNHLTLVNNPSFPSAQIYKVAVDGPFLETQCVTGGGSDLYAADHIPSEAPGPAELRYQVSGDGTNWWYYRSAQGWVPASAGDWTQANLLYELREHLPYAPINTGTFCLRAYFVSDGRTGLGLDRFEILAPPATLAFLAQPAAGRPAPGSMRVVFETDMPAEAYVEYRTLASAPAGPWIASPVTNGGTVFGIDITGLDPAADYEYRVRHRPRGASTGFASTVTKTIPVAPVIDATAQLEFAVWGDSRPAEGVPTQPQVFYQMMERIAGERPAFHIAVGDNVNLTGAQPFTQETAIDFYRGWRYAYDIAAGSGYMFFALGNHDEDLPEPARSKAAVARLRSTVQPTDGDASQRYYSWRWGDALFIAMDGSAANPKAAQVDWILQKLQEPARWKFVFNHYPFWNSDRGIPSAAIRDQLHAAFVAAGVNVVFQAHDHWYADTVVDGIHYTTSGGGGSPLRPGDVRFNPIVEYHYLRVALDEFSVAVNAIQVNENGTGGPVLARYCVASDDAPTTDSDGDGEADVCDPDDDNDGIPDTDENVATPGPDNLVGSVGDDTLDGQGGADVMTGLAGDDTYYVDDAGDLVVESNGGGTDLVHSAISYTLPGNVEHLVLSGSAAINGTGNDLNNSLNGNAADNVLDGLTGTDTMAGKAGNDTYYVDNSGDVVTEVPGEGTDTVRSGITYALPANVENLVLIGTSAITGTGNGLANALTGNSAANILNGLGGNDAIGGGTGNDQLNGGLGVDNLTGGAGQDSFVFDAAPGSTNADDITDFYPPDDVIRLDRAAFTSLTKTGTLGKAAFKLGTAASTTAHRIIYDQATGYVYYDADGTGAAAQVRFATLVNKPAISRSDFFVQ